MGRDGYIKLYRKLLDNPVVMRDADHLSIWVYLLLEARKFEKEAYLGGKKITLKPGQLTTGRKQISEKLRVMENKVQRVLKLYETEHLIEQQTTNRNRLISIVEWESYQDNEQLNEQQINNRCTTNEQPVNTPKESKKEKKDNNIYYGEFENVALSEEELEKLKQRFPYDWQERIERLSSYMKSRGKRYKSHYATILAWAGKERKDAGHGTDCRAEKRTERPDAAGEEYENFFK